MASTSSFASSFTYFPGVPILRSSNLVDWTQIGNVLDRPSQLDLSGTKDWSSAGIFAPTIRHHDGRFWMITTVFSSKGLKNFFVTADDPAGPWSEPVVVPIIGIDPDIAWDDEGNCWVHHSLGGIHRARIDDRTGEVLDAPVPTWSGSGLYAPEAPHLFQRDGVWYLLIAEGGTERGHAVSIARGPSPAGPWEGCPANPILSHRSTDRPVQSTGHADLVEASDGSWWALLLGVRPLGTTPGFHVMGRETFLTPVEWVDRWPVVAPVDLEIDHRPPGADESIRAAGEASGRDEFDAARLDHRWVTIRRPAADFASLLARPGSLTIDGAGSSLDSANPAYVGRRQQHHRCRARTRVDIGADGGAGLSVMMDREAHYDVFVRGERVVARARVGPLVQVVGEAPRPPGPVTLCVETAPHPLGPDMVVLGFEDDANVVVLAELDGRYLSTEVAGGFIGRTIGVFAEDCTADFAWFDYAPIDG